MSWPAVLILPSGVKDPSNDYYDYIKEIEAKKSKRVVDSYPLPAKYNQNQLKRLQLPRRYHFYLPSSPTCRICRTTKMPRWGRMWDLWGKVFSSDGKAWANRWRQPPLSWRTFRPRRVRQKPVPDGHCPHPPRKRKCPGRRCQTPKLSHQQCCGIACEIYTQWFIEKNLISKRVVRGILALNLFWARGREINFFGYSIIIRKCLRIVRRRENKG